MRLRLILSFTLVVLITIASLVVFIRQGTAETVRTFMFRGGVTGVEDLVAELEDYYLQNGSWQGSEVLFASLRSTGAPGRQGMGAGPGAGANSQESAGKHLRLLDADGTVIFDNKTRHPSETIDQQTLGLAIPLQVDGQTVGYLLSEGNPAFTSDQEQQLLSRLNRAALTAAAVAGGASLLLVLLLSYSLLRPVRALTQAAARMAEGDLDQRVAVQGNDEIAMLGRTFNHMADALQQAEERRRALTADIAHELRTPLAVQRAHLEALQDGIYELTLENLVPIEEQTHLLARLVEDLRTLALADAGELTLERVPTDFPALVERTVARFDPQAGAQGVAIRRSLLDEPLTLSLDPQRIEQIINNLLDNALRYTPAGGTIEVTLTRSGNQAVLRVRDGGSGIPEEALPHIFERFYKADRSRGRSGTGLGLSIARKLAQAHGGDLTAENHPDGGAIFTLVLPV